MQQSASQILQPLIKQGMSEQDAYALLGVFHPYIQSRIEEKLSEVFSEDEADRMNEANVGKTPEESITVLENAYEIKTGKTLLQTFNETASETVQFLAEVVSKYTVFMEKLRLLDKTNLEQLVVAWENKDVERARNILVQTGALHDA